MYLGVLRVEGELLYKAISIMNSNDMHRHRVRKKINWIYKINWLKSRNDV